MIVQEIGTDADVWDLRSEDVALKHTFVADRESRPGFTHWVHVPEKCGLCWFLDMAVKGRLYEHALERIALGISGRAADGFEEGEVGSPGLMPRTDWQLAGEALAKAKGVAV